MRRHRFTELECLEKRSGFQGSFPMPRVDSITNLCSCRYKNNFLPTLHAFFNLLSFFPFKNVSGHSTNFNDYDFFKVPPCSLVFLFILVQAMYNYFVARNSFHYVFRISLSFCFPPVLSRNLGASSAASFDILDRRKRDFRNLIVRRKIMFVGIFIQIFVQLYISRG